MLKQLRVRLNQLNLNAFHAGKNIVHELEKSSSGYRVIAKYDTGYEQIICSERTQQDIIKALDEFVGGKWNE